jgi:hypothetical protein
MILRPSVLKVVVVAAIMVYATMTLALWAAMRRPPDEFGQIMARMPAPLFMVLPFKPMWLSVRSGSLRVGDTAPDFQLETVDRKSRTRLSDDRGKPVVLIFGSYT